MPKVDKAAVSCARSVGGGAIVVSMLSAEAPAASLPEGALFNPMTGVVLTAPKAVWELDLGSSMLLAKYSMAL